MSQRRAAVRETDVQFIYFDLGNVLLHFCHDRMCRQLAAVAGVAEEVVRRVVLDNSSLRRHETGRLDPVTFLDTPRSSRQ